MRSILILEGYADKSSKLIPDSTKFIIIDRETRTDRSHLDFVQPNAAKYHYEPIQCFGCHKEKPRLFGVESVETVFYFISGYQNAISEHNMSDDNLEHFNAGFPEH